VRYKDGSTRVFTRGKKATKDHLLSLEDTKRNGVYDQAKTVLECELPSCMLFLDDWLYVACRGSLWRYKRSKPGAPYDVQEEIIRGFGGKLFAPVSGISIGPDGWLYLTVHEGDHFAEGSDGSRATVLQTGAVFRCRPDGSRLHVYAQGLRRPEAHIVWDVSHFAFLADQAEAGGRKVMGVRLHYLAEGADFGYRLEGPFPNCVPPTVRGSPSREQSGTVPPLLTIESGTPSGLLSLQDACVPERLQGLLLCPDYHRPSVRTFRVEPLGAGFTASEEQDFLRSNDPAFRPGSMLVGPDGALYLCGCGAIPHGRIYRLRWTGTQAEPAIPLRPQDSWQKLLTSSDEQLFQALASPNNTERNLASRELARRGEKHRPALLKLVKDGDAVANSRLAALSALTMLWNAEVQTACVELLGDVSPDLRRKAGDLLAWESTPNEAPHLVEPLVKALSDRDPAVRRAVALALGRLGGPAAADALANAYRFDEGKDLWLRNGLLHALERLDSLGVDRLLTLAESGRAADLQAAIRGFAAFGTRPAAMALPRLLANPHLTEAEQQTLLLSYQNYRLDPPLDLEPLLGWLEQHLHGSPKLKLAALASLSTGGGLTGERARKLLLQLLQAEPEEGIRLAALRAVQDTKLNSAVPLVLEWLPQKRTPAERAELLRALVTFQEVKAVDFLEKALQDGEWAALQDRVLFTLAALDTARGNAAAQNLLSSSDPAVARAAISLLGQTPEGAKLVGQSYLAKKISWVHRHHVQATLGQHAEKSQELRQMMTTIGKEEKVPPGANPKGN
jgi:HEAT repeat protein/glucose/arabinose dehydrogenase